MADNTDKVGDQLRPLHVDPDIVDNILLFITTVDPEKVDNTFPVSLDARRPQEI